MFVCWCQTVTSRTQCDCCYTPDPIPSQEVEVAAEEQGISYILIYVVLRNPKGVTVKLFSWIR